MDQVARNRNGSPTNPSAPSQVRSAGTPTVEPSLLEKWPTRLADLQPLVEIAKRARNLATKGKIILQGRRTTIQAASSAQKLTMALMARSTQTLEATVGLLTLGYSGQAMILVRSLLETSLVVARVFKEDSETEKLCEKFLAFGEWADLAYHLRPQVREQLVRLGRLKEADLRGLSQRHGELEGKYNLETKEWYRGGVAQLARDAGQVDLHEHIYSFLCRYSHPSIQWLGDHFKFGEGRVEIPDGPDETHTFLALHMATFFYVAIARAWDEVYNLGIGPGLTDLEAALHEIKGPSGPAA